jgi:hypothetical protein
MTSVEIVPVDARLSVTVGTVWPFDNVFSVKSTGPMPRIPSTPWKPCDFEATPIDCLVITRSGDRVTVSMYSSPEKDPEPYETD